MKTIIFHVRGFLIGVYMGFWGTLKRKIGKGDPTPLQQDKKNVDEILYTNIVNPALLEGNNWIPASGNHQAYKDTGKNPENQDFVLPPEKSKVERPRNSQAINKIIHDTLRNSHPETYQKLIDQQLIGNGHKSQENTSPRL